MQLWCCCTHYELDELYACDFTRTRAVCQTFDADSRVALCQLRKLQSAQEICAQNRIIHVAVSESQNRYAWTLARALVTVCVNE